MKTFACDRCGQEFGGPLDEEQYTDENGVTTIFDLCAPCRKELKTAKQKAEKAYFDKLKGKRG